MSSNNFQMGHCEDCLMYECEVASLKGRIEQLEKEKEKLYDRCLEDEEGYMKNGCINYGWTCPKCGRTYSLITPICSYCSKEIAEKEIEEYEKFGENRDKLNKKDILTEDNG